MFDAYKKLILEHEFLATLGQNLVGLLPFVFGREADLVTLEGFFALSFNLPSIH